MILRMLRREAPASLAALIERVRENPSIFYNRPRSDQKFLLGRVCNWIDSWFFQVRGGQYESRMETLTLSEKIALEAKVFRFIKNVIFYPDRSEAISAQEWFMYATVRDF